ncbi:hypothetical protein E0485_14660 [Paenibacillus albiflavus]|uniref:Uncharacterized protein n=1 Tax=Paenibacillus albiflavus TaxID=2545760 RepID=A0A4R4EDL6_9BACL|nr:crossover junction endodeoxyribonuclease RuvC [Paenibacillus albiflavus]TCZ76085.1 hypothetical protein E0485_14660 [Paenibacillus albiflavus]
MRYVGIDPSTKTGFVALDELGNVIRGKELTGVGKVDPKRMITLIDEIMDHIQPDDVIVIEGFGFASQQAIQLGGIGWGIRMALHRRGFSYIEASPSQLKKYATGKGNTKKDDMVLPIFKRWGFENTSDNVRDAYVLAQIARALCSPIEIQLTSYQADVLQAMKNPSEKKTRKKKAV